MKRTVARDYEYTPAWEGNRNESEPTVFELRLLSTEQSNRWIRLDQGTQTLADYQGMFRDAVRKIRGLEINGKVITTAEEFLKTEGLSALFTEMAIRIYKDNEKPDLKN